MNGMAHFVKQRFHIVPSEQGRASNLDSPKVGRENNDRALILAGWASDRVALNARAVPLVQIRHHVTRHIIIVDPPRAPHGIVRRIGRFPLAREKVAVNHTNRTLALVNHV